MNLKLIPLTERYPEPNQDVIAYNSDSNLLVAAKFVKEPYREKGRFQVEKYVNTYDRSIVTYWLEEDITHWMPAKINL